MSAADTQQPPPSTSRSVFYTAATATNGPTAIDYVVRTVDGKEIGAYGGETAEQMSERLGTTVLKAPVETFCQDRDACYVTQPEQISEEAFDCALNCLPPLHWGKWSSVESFRMSEFYVGNITTIYARHPDGSHWKFRDSADLSGDAIATKVLHAAERAACVH